VFFTAGQLSPAWRLSYTDEKGGVQPIASTPTTVASGRIHVARVDRDAQEDSLHFQWAGKGLAGVELDSREAFDFTRETNGDVFLVLSVRVDTPPTSRVDVGMACGAQCAGAVRVDEALSRLPPATWQRLAIPLKCFAKAGADMHNITTGLSLRTAGPLDVTISRVALGVDSDQKVACAR
jgi:beta-glucosidase